MELEVQTITFKVADVKTVNPKTVKCITDARITLHDLVSKRLDTKECKHVVEAVSKSDADFCGYTRHGFFNAVYDAYCDHIGLELDPDHIKLLILQGFAIHINENAEEFRDKLVNHQDKKVIHIRRDDFIKGQDNPWSDLFSEFANKIKSDIKDPELVNLVQTQYQTTTDVTQAACNISMMDIVQKYYSYEMSTRCGIPFVTLRGSIDDWASLTKLIDYIEHFKLKWWTDKLRSIIDECVKAVSGNHDAIFWNDIFNINNESGGPFYDGWMTHFFPYILKEKSMIRNDFGEIKFCVPTGLSTVDVKWMHLDEVFNMNFTAGFFGFSITDTCIRPEISWAVYEVKPVPERDLISADIKMTWSIGTYFNPSGKHYGKILGRVNCDYCKTENIKQCIGLDKVDLCMKCIDKLDIIFK